jgi:predicted P-loop ATPase/GTPase
MLAYSFHISPLHVLWLPTDVLGAMVSLVNELAEKAKRQGS